MPTIMSKLPSSIGIRPIENVRSLSVIEQSRIINLVSTVFPLVTSTDKGSSKSVRGLKRYGSNSKDTKHLLALESNDINV
jgi:hypothetical protein